MSTQPVHQEIALTPSLLRIDFAGTGTKLPKKAKAKSSSLANKKTAARRKPVATKKSRATKSTTKPRMRHEEIAEQVAAVTEATVAIAGPVVEQILCSTFEAVPEPVAPVPDFAVTETSWRPEAETQFNPEPPLETGVSTEIIAAAEVQSFKETPSRPEAVEVETAMPEHIAAEVQKKALPPILWTSITTLLARAWSWARQRMKSHQVRKRLRVCETVSLGEKRFVAVIQVDGQQFLVGGSSTSVSTLAQLEPARDFSDVLQRTSEQGLSQA